MPDPKLPQLPFLTRDMLSFGASAKIELEAVVYSDVTFEVLMVGITREGIFKFPISHNAGDTLEEVKTFGVPDIPISLTVFTDSASIERGEYLASIFLKVNGERVYKLCSGYVTKHSGINFPQTHDESEVGPHGLIKKVTGLTPAAFDEIDATVSANERWRLMGFRFEFTTDANAADRKVRLLIGVGSGGRTEEIICIGNFVHTASLEKFYSWAPYGGPVAISQGQDVAINIPPDLWINSLGHIETDTENFQAGDKFTNVVAIVEAYIED